MSNLYLYWVHHKDHTDITREGYIGVSIDPDRRFKQHTQSDKNPHLSNALRKYKDLITFSILAEGDTDYILGLEQKLRPERQIGWNINMGGGLPPPNVNGNRRGAILSDEQKEKISKSLTGRKMPEGFGRRILEKRKLNGTFQEGKNHVQSKIWVTPEGVFYSCREGARFHSISDWSVRHRCHSTLEKFEGWFVEEKINE